MLLGSRKVLIVRQDRPQEFANGPDGEEVLEEDRPERSEVLQRISGHIPNTSLVEPDILVDGPIADVGWR
jgi:hypothetical protein